MPARPWPARASAPARVGPSSRTVGPRRSSASEESAVRHQADRARAAGRAQKGAHIALILRRGLGTRRTPGPRGDSCRRGGGAARRNAAARRWASASSAATSITASTSSAPALEGGCDEGQSRSQTRQGARVVAGPFASAGDVIAEKHDGDAAPAPPIRGSPGTTPASSSARSRRRRRRAQGRGRSKITKRGAGERHAVMRDGLRVPRRTANVSWLLALPRHGRRSGFVIAVCRITDIARVLHVADDLPQAEKGAASRCSKHGGHERATAAAFSYAITVLKRRARPRPLGPRSRGHRTCAT